MNLKEYIKTIKDRTDLYINNPNIDLTELSKFTGGITPSELKEILDLPSSRLKNELTNVAPIYNLEPNPIDYDWRFDKETINSITNMLKTRHSNIGCFGVPTIFKELSNSLNVTLFDINPFLKPEFYCFADHIIEVDLNSNLIYGYEFDAIIMDPPWYTEYYLLWLKQAINNLKKGGVIYVSKFPPLVRPSAQEDWNRIIEATNHFLGKEKKEFNLLYETPPFEKETFIANGLYNIGNWRIAELVSFELINKVYQNITFESKNEWKRYRFGNKIVSLKLESDIIDELEVKSPYTDGSYILKSVSKRHIARQQINFITSRNTSLIIKGTHKVDNFLQELSLNKNINEIIDSKYSQKEILGLKIIHSLIGI